MKRRLAAIMAADVVGYSRLIRADEEGTLAALKALRADLIDPKLAEHNGRIVKLMGDGILAEFPSVVDAVRAAVATQKAVTERNSALSEDKRIEFRVGINLGDVVIDGDDIHGDGVNVAARLEALAAPGAVCISHAVYEQIRDRVPLEFRDLGERQVKNFNRPIRAWQLDDPIAVSADGQAAARPAVSTHPSTAIAETLFERPAVLVAPFETIGDDPDDQYFTRGVSEDIGSTLSYWRWMPVIGPAAVPPAENGRDLPSIARSLGAGYAVGGSLRRSGSRVRLMAVLVHADTSQTLWSRRFDGTAEDIFDFQEKLSEQVVALIEPEIERAEQSRLRKVRPGNLTAWDYLLKAAEAQRKGGPGYGSRESNHEAMRLIDAAIEADPELADAWAARAQRYWFTVIANWTEDREAAMARSLECSQRAIELDPGNAFARSAYAIVKLFGHGDVIAARDNALEAIRLNPSSPHARHIGGCVLEFLGEAEPALVHLDSIFRLNPNHFAAAVAQADQMTCHLILGQHDQAVEIGRRMKSRDPNYIRGLQRYVAALAHAGLVEEARVELANLLAKQPDLSEDYMRATYPFQKPEHLELIIDGLRMAGFKDPGEGIASPPERV